MQPSALPAAAGRRDRATAPLLAVLIIIILGGCAARPALSPSPLPRDEMKGAASWYGHQYHGKPTANGEIYDMNALTAAHRTLPFNSHVKVQRTDNGREVEVRVNDRGPYVDGRVIDLSRGAAQKLDMVNKGVAPVQITPIEVPDETGSRWSIVVGGLPPADTDRLAARLRGAGPRAPQVIYRWNGDPSLAQVWLRGYAAEDDARRVVNQLREEGYPAFLVRTRM